MIPLIFRQLSKHEKEQDFVETEEEAYGLFKEDGTHLGTSICTTEELSRKSWLLRKIYIHEEFQGKRYGSELLEKTCRHLWSIKKVPIKLQLVRGTSIPNAFNLYKWYQKHGFKGLCETGAFLYREPDM